jgi:8-oxo-dGTP pyrophosphatase MutT (NUDIX family)
MLPWPNPAVTAKLARMSVGETQFWIGVHGVIARADGRILVLRRAPEMLYRPGHWDLPGGHLALKEEIHQCLLREIIEETSLEVEVGPLLGLNKASDGPYVQMIFFCRPKSDVCEVKLLPQEHDAAQWVSIAELHRVYPLIPYLAAILSRGMLDGSR